MTVQQRIGRKIKALRALRGIRQLDLARLTDVPQPHLSRYEQGRWYAVNPAHLLRIADALHVSVDELIR